MSKEYYQFENEKGDVAFLIGLVDAISDRLQLVCDYGYDLEADIFPLPDNDISMLNNVVRKRMNLYAEQEGDYNIEKINQIDFKLTQKDHSNVNEYVCSKIKKYSSGKKKKECVCSRIKKYSSGNKIKEEVNHFLALLKFHFDAPIGLYEPVNLQDSNVAVLGELYLSFAWDYFFIAYKGYVVMMIFGTSE